GDAAPREPRPPRRASGSAARARDARRRRRLRSRGRPPLGCSGGRPARRRCAIYDLTCTALPRRSLRRAELLGRRYPPLPRPPVLPPARLALRGRQVGPVLLDGYNPKSFIPRLDLTLEARTPVRRSQPRDLTEILARHQLVNVL